MKTLLVLLALVLWPIAALTAVTHLPPTPSAEVLCARQPGRVWLASEHACIPANALWPAVERTP